MTFFTCCWRAQRRQSKTDNVALFNIYKNAIRTACHAAFFASDGGSLAYDPMYAGPQAAHYRNCVLFRNAHGCALGGVLGVVLVCKEDTNQNERECFL